jgi:hypothetical protein
MIVDRTVDSDLKKEMEKLKKRIDSAKERDAHTSNPSFPIF